MIMKKTYIAPHMETFQINLSDGILIGLSGTHADSAAGVETKGSCDWDIWGNGSDSDYDDSDY